MQYVITNADKNKNGMITHVQIDGTIHRHSKEDVIEHLLRGVIYRIPSGAPVRIVDNKYLRADRNTDEWDDLGELPPCISLSSEQ